MHERVRAGAHGDAVRLQGAQMLGGYVFVIEGDHVAAPREVTQRVEVAIVADDDIADDLRRGILRGVTEELELDAERDARLVCHTSELPPPTMPTTGNVTPSGYRSRRGGLISVPLTVLFRVSSRPVSGFAGAGESGG